MMNFKIMKYLSTIIFFAVSVFAQDSTDQEERDKILKEYQQISLRLADLQKQALSDFNIAKQAEDFSKNLEKAMLQQNPSVSEKINRRDEVVDEFEKADRNGDQTEVVKLQEEYEEITQDLMQYQQNVLKTNEQIKKEGDALEDTLFEKMQEIDPEVSELVSRLETLNNQIRGLAQDRSI